MPSHFMCLFRHSRQARCMCFRGRSRPGLLSFVICGALLEDEMVDVVDSTVGAFGGEESADDCDACVWLGGLDWLLDDDGALRSPSV